MFQQKRPHNISLPLNQMRSVNLQDLSPSLSRKRKSKVNSIAKTNEQLITEAHEMLMNYVDNVEQQVKTIVDDCQSQFFLAYRKYYKQVKEQLAEINKRMLQNSNSQKIHQERISCLEKQLALFREETLKMSEKLIKQKQVNENLNIHLKQIIKQNQYQQQKISDLTKENMQLSAAIERLKLDKETNIQQKMTIDRASIKKYLNQANMGTIDRPGTTTYFTKSNTFQIRSHSIKKGDLKLLTSTVEKPTYHQEKSREKSQIQPQSEEKSNSQQTNMSNQKKYYEGFRAKYQKNRLKSLKMFQSQIEKIKSKGHAEKRQYEKLFITCVQQVKKDIIRKGRITTLNYFKKNGPKDLIQFKKLDYFTLLQLFLKCEPITKKIFQLIFEISEE